MDEFKWQDREKLQPDIKVSAWMIHKALPAQPKFKWWHVFGFKPKVTEFYYYGWLETNDSKGFLCSGDIIFVGRTYDDPIGIKFYINKLTSYNSKIRTYDVSSCEATVTGNLKGHYIFKLYSAAPL